MFQGAFRSGSGVVAGVVAQFAQLPGDGRAGEMGIDLVEALGAEALANFGDIGALAGAGQREGPFDRGGLVMSPIWGLGDGLPNPGEDRSFQSAQTRSISRSCRPGGSPSGWTEGRAVQVTISDSRLRVRCTGHLSATSSNRARRSSSSGTSKAMIRSKRSCGGALVARRDDLVGDLDPEAGQVPALAGGVEADGHRRARAERGRKQLIGRRAGPAAADVSRVRRRRS